MTATAFSSDAFQASLGKKQSMNLQLFQRAVLGTEACWAQPATGSGVALFLMLSHLWGSVPTYRAPTCSQPGKRGALGCPEASRALGVCASWIEFQCALDPVHLSFWSLYLKASFYSAAEIAAGWCNPANLKIIFLIATSKDTVWGHYTQVGTFLGFFHFSWKRVKMNFLWVISTLIYARAMIFLLMMASF